MPVDAAAVAAEGGVVADGVVADEVPIDIFELEEAPMLPLPLHADKNNDATITAAWQNFKL